MILVAGGLALFFKNMEEGFDVSLFLRRESQKEHLRECWVDTRIWEKEYKTKEGRITFMKKRLTLLSGILTSMLGGGSEGRGKGNKIEQEGLRVMKVDA
jgi:hypothetical protein